MTLTIAEGAAEFFERRQRGPNRIDPIIGEIVRILVRADAATLARIYAVAKAEEAAMDAHMNDSLNDFFRQHTGKSGEGDGKYGDPPASGPERTASRIGVSNAFLPPSGSSETSFVQREALDCVRGRRLPLSKGTKLRVRESLTSKQADESIDQVRTSTRSIILE